MGECRCQSGYHVKAGICGKHSVQSLCNYYIELRHLDVLHVVRVWPSGERLHNQMWLHRFYVISLSTIYLGAITCDINTIGFVSVSAQCACRVLDVLVAMLCNRSLGDATVHEQKWTSGMTQLMLALLCILAYKTIIGYLSNQLTAFCSGLSGWIIWNLFFVVKLLMDN